MNIGIIGTSYCGSTLTSVLLDGMPGVSAVGETYCILDKDMSKMRNCLTCADECEYLTDAFIASMKADPSDWWSKLRSQFGAEHIVLSDKWHVLYERLGLPDIVLMIWREPAKWCCSWLMHQALKIRDDVTLTTLYPSNDDVISSLKIWSNFYDAAITWTSCRGIKTIGLSFDDLLSDPTTELEMLCRRLGIEYSSDALDYMSKPHHHIRGNASVTRTTPSDKHPEYWAEHLKKIKPGSIVPDDRHRVAFTTDQIKMMRSDPFAAEVLVRLCQLGQK